MAFVQARRRVCARALSAVALGLVVAACSKGRPGNAPNAAGHSGDAGGSSAEHGGSGGVKAMREAGSGGGTAGSQAGSSGNAAQGGGAASTREYGSGDVDLTLGGFNQDLPAPTVDCLSDNLDNYVCFSATVQVDGVTHEIACIRASTISQSGGSFTCLSASNESVQIDAGDFEVPGTFSVVETSVPGSILQLTLMQGMFNSRASNFQEARVAGWANKWDDHGHLRNKVTGTVACSWRADPDAGTGMTRVRASFRSRNFF
jgi:hypothetical protein